MAQVVSAKNPTSQDEDFPGLEAEMPVLFEERIIGTEYEPVTVMPTIG
jgi:hypothetical protein